MPARKSFVLILKDWSRVSVWALFLFAMMMLYWERDIWKGRTALPSIGDAIVTVLLLAIVAYSLCAGFRFLLWVLYLTREKSQSLHAALFGRFPQYEYDEFSAVILKRMRLK